MIFNIGVPVEETMPLRQLKVGEKALVARILAEGELGRRLRDMGLVPGEEVMVVGRAPLKDPVALRLKGFTLSLRNDEADFILVSVPEGARPGRPLKRTLTRERGRLRRARS